MGAAMKQKTAADTNQRLALEQAIASLRPRLHRFCARMTGSAIDGEDVVQDALLKALESPPDTDSLLVLESWLFRVAHSTAVDYLRRRNRLNAAHSDEDVNMLLDPGQSADSSAATAAHLRTFMRLPPLQRSCVILKDVLGYSIEETAKVTGGSIAAIKSALQRGRASLRELVSEPQEIVNVHVDDATRIRLERYVDRFNARDFDAVRDMLADDVRLDLVGRRKRVGKAGLGLYFTNYENLKDWFLVAGTVDGTPALLVFDSDELDGRPLYFVVLDWLEDRIVRIQDYRVARYALDGAVIRLIPRIAGIT
jgi:RNA polymerase sigma-70 factor (ECF subfamily)